MPDCACDGGNGMSTIELPDSVKTVHVEFPGGYVHEYTREEWDQIETETAPTRQAIHNELLRAYARAVETKETHE